MIHRRTMWAVTFGVVGGWLAGGIEPMALSFGLCVVVGIGAIIALPHSEDVAAAWLSRDDSEGSE